MEENNDLYERIAELLRSGMKQSDIAETVGCSAWLVCKVNRLYNIRRNRPQKEQRKLPKRQLPDVGRYREIIDAIKSGKSERQVKKELSCSNDTISRAKKLLCRTETRKCIECGFSFERTETSDKKCCSKDCSRKRINRRSDIRLNKSNIVDSDITLPVLFKRDGGFCALCGAACLFYVDGNHDLYPSIDHIMPISKGGKHSWDNVQLAHRWCNIKKRDSYDEVM